MTEANTSIARAAAARLSAGSDPGLRREVETALRGPSPHSFTDVVGIGGLIVAIVAIAWTIYKDLRKTTPRPDAVTVKREIRMRIGHDEQHMAPDDVISVVVEETVAYGESTQ